MDVKIKNSEIWVEGKPFFIQGMNLFLDPFRLEKSPRKIYSPRICPDDICLKIIRQLKKTRINTVRIWPTNINNKYELCISERIINELGAEGFKIIFNFPVNWNCKPRLIELKNYLSAYSERKFDHILMYCISNEVYHGLVAPHPYLDSIQSLVKKYSSRPTLVTNANLNFPWYFKADVVGADFFTYKYSISRDGVQDVGTVAQMFFEDAELTYRHFPRFVLKFYPFIVRYLQKKAIRGNFQPKYFRKNLMKVLKGAQKHHRPYLICEYGYTENLDHLAAIYDYLPIREMCGHIWYNWTNFDPNVDGVIENQPLFDKFCQYIERIGVIKERLSKKERKGATLLC